MTTQKPIHGSMTALVTPFKDGKVDETAFGDFVNWQIESGTHGLVPCGTTGESATLSDDEHKRVIKLCVEAAAGRVPVIAGAGSNETTVSIRYASHAKDLGADAALIVTPYYNKPSQEGIFQHFKAISDAVDIPIIVYNIPGRSVVDISNETMARLSTLPTVIGCKDATGDISRVTTLIDRCGEDFIQLSGDDPTSLAHSVYGGKGCISVGSNVAPDKYAAFHNAMLSGDYALARKLHEKLDRLHKDLFLDPSPAPAKYALTELGRMGPDVRLPMTPCRDETKAAVIAAMKRAGITI
ncbi:4-hydroxy-tetrahydrodipicolinate synthase [Robiginitomaculum antarcticum]|uniref:4-hydroxy-tetrahydrodipicolinate synthase n=1 Tax=Robiginitomaculum antarcticum TaxID=437507 RepID=UPI00037E5618|nr:4-hydroxy-tetrahydrodipicolinate synthase [Robiginitomaculum antarcticum]